MSNGENVLDSWEEIDEADLDKSLQRQLKTETLNKAEQESLVQSDKSAEFVVNTSSSFKSTTASATTLQNIRPMKILHRTPADGVNSSAVNSSSAGNEISALDTMADSMKPVIMMLNNTNDEYQSVNYTAPIANQTVKILRRPTQQSEAERRNGMAKPKQQFKSLQQREQEYAEARLRIMGAAKNPEDDLTDAPNSTATLTGNVRTTNSDQLASTSNNSKEKLDLEKTLPTQALIVDARTTTGYGGSSMHSNLLKTNYIPPHQTPQNYCYPTALGSCNDVFVNRPMTMMAMPPQHTLLTAQNYSHLNTGLYPLQQQQQQPPPQNRPYSKQYSIQQQQQNPYYKGCPTIMSGGGGGVGGGGGIGINAAIPSHTKLIQQSQNNKVFYLKNNNSNNNKNQNQQNTMENESILRLPRGPDGSQGFQMRR